MKGKGERIIISNRDIETLENPGDKSIDEYLGFLVSQFIDVNPQAIVVPVEPFPITNNAISVPFWERGR